MPEDTRDENKLALISRMLTYQQASGETIPDTLRKLSSNLPDSYLDSINDVKSITSGDDGVLKKYKSERFSLLIKLMAVVRKEGGDTSTLLVSIHDSISEGIDQADSFWEGFQSVMSYLITVFAVAILVVTIFVLKVLPQFRATFNDFGVELPEFTRFVLENDFALLIVIFLFGVCTAGFSLLYFHVKRQVAKLEGLSRYCRFIPGLQDLHGIYAYFLYVQYTKVLIQAGVGNSIALKHAKNLSNVAAGTDELSVYSDAINVASEMEVLDKELSHQDHHIGSLFSRKMSVLRSSLTRGVQAALGVVVGGLIIAMYLPIFALGSAV